ACTAQGGLRSTIRTIREAVGLNAHGGSEKLGRRLCRGETAGDICGESAHFFGGEYEGRRGVWRPQGMDSVRPPSSGPEPDADPGAGPEADPVRVGLQKRRAGSA